MSAKFSSWSRKFTVSKFVIGQWFRLRMMIMISISILQLVSFKTFTMSNNCSRLNLMFQWLRPFSGDFHVGLYRHKPH
jgi:hypothetical protein